MNRIIRYLLGPSRTRSTMTYTAFYQNDHSRIIYRRQAAQVPKGAVPIDDPRSTYFRTDGGDRFAFAWFTLGGETIIVQRDGTPPQNPS